MPASVILCLLVLRVRGSLIGSGQKAHRPQQAARLDAHLAVVLAGDVDDLLALEILRLLPDHRDAEGVVADLQVDDVVGTQLPFESLALDQPARVVLDLGEGGLGLGEPARAAPSSGRWQPCSSGRRRRLPDAQARQGQQARQIGPDRPVSLPPHGRSPSVALVRLNFSSFGAARPSPSEQMTFFGKSASVRANCGLTSRQRATSSAIFLAGGKGLAAAAAKHIRDTQARRLMPLAIEILFQHQRVQRERQLDGAAHDDHLAGLLVGHERRQLGRTASPPRRRTAAADPARHAVRGEQAHVVGADEDARLLEQLARRALLPRLGRRRGSRPAGPARPSSARSSAARTGRRHRPEEARRRRERDSDTRCCRTAVQRAARPRLGEGAAAVGAVRSSFCGASWRGVLVGATLR